MIGRQSGDHRPNDGRYPAYVSLRLLDKMSSTDRRAIDGRLTPDDRATVGRFHDVNFFKKSADCMPIIGRPSPDASPMTKRLKIGGSVNETFNLGASTKKLSADQKMCKNRCRCRPTIGRRRPIFPFFAHRPSGDRWFGQCDCCITVVMWGGTIKVVGNTDHTMQTWIHMQRPLSPPRQMRSGGWRDEWLGP